MPGFKDTKLNHDLVSLYEQNRENFINIGLSEKYFNTFIKELNKFQELALRKDLSMCFKYPIYKDESPIISDKLLLLPFTDIQNILKEHSILICIAIYIDSLGNLSSIKKYKELCKQKII